MMIAGNRFSARFGASWLRRQQQKILAVGQRQQHYSASRLNPKIVAAAAVRVVGRSKVKQHQYTQRLCSTKGNGPRMASAPPPPPRGNNNNSQNGLPAYVWLPVAATTGMIGYSYYAFLDEVPLTHRKRWIATSPQWETKLGHEEYKKLLKQYQDQGQVLPPDHRASITVKRVGSSIAKAAEKFANEHQVVAHNNHNSSTPYTYTVVRSDMANAFVLPGNHVFVMTGLFKYVQNEDQLAAILGHETAHNLARHAGERMSSSFFINGLARLSLVVDPSGILMAIFLPATKLLRDLPHSRTQETEADQIGIYLAAEACYDPRAAKRVFAAMKEGSDGVGGSPPEFLSTHPSHESRISNFDDWLPDAMKVYEGGGDDYSDDGGRCRHVRQQMQAARKDAAHRAAAREQFPK